MSTSLDTRERLLRQGRVAFAEKGHNGVSLQRDVLGPAGVSNGSFYHQFSDKTDLLVAILEDGAAKAREWREESATEAPVERTVEGARQRLELWFKYVDRSEDLFRIRFHERNNPDKRVRELVSEVHDRSSKFIEDRFRTESELGSKLADPELAVRLMRALVSGVLVDYMDTPKRRRAAERQALAAGMTTFMAGGLQALAKQDARTKAVAS